MIRHGNSIFNIGGSIPCLFDLDASKVIEAVRSTGVTITPAMMHYAHYLISNMKNIGTWQLSNAVYGIIGGTAASHAINWRNIGTYDLTFFNSPTQSSAGILWNGTTQYAKTGLIPSTTLSSTSTHLSYYTPTNNLTGIQVPIGITTATPRFLQLNIVNANYSSGETPSILFYTPTSTNGYTIGTRTAINAQAVFYRGVKIASSTFNGSATLPELDVWLGARNGNNAGPQFLSRHTCAFSSIGAGLTDTQAQQQSQIVTNAQAILNRA